MSYQDSLSNRLKELASGGYMSAAEVAGARDLFIRHHQGAPTPVEWARVQALSDSDYRAYDSLPELTGPSLAKAMQKVAILKLNGGLGTSMGCKGPKTLIPVKNKMSFLEIIVRQVFTINAKYGVSVPLLLMNSFNTEKDTKAALAQIHLDKPVDIICFNQAHFPRIDAETLLPCTHIAPDSQEYWYPPGHGDVLRSLISEGLVDKLITRGVEWVFISSGDNLGAVVDPRIVGYLATLKGIDFVSEQTAKTIRDVKGGVLINYDGTIRLLETAQVPHEHMSEFCDIKKFKSFNVNSIWVRLEALKRLTDAGTSIDLDIIVNPKMVEGKRVLQLEQAVGAGITFFKSEGLLVSRDRFIPVKKTCDLLTVQSDVYDLDSEYTLRACCPIPNVELCAPLEKMDAYCTAFQCLPSLRGADTVKILSQCTIGPNVKFRGTCIIDSTNHLENCTLGQ